MATVATDPATGGGAQTEPVCLHGAAQPLQGGRAASPTVAAGAALGRCLKCRLWMNRRRRRQPRRSDRACAPPVSAVMAPLATSITEPPDPPAPPLPAIFAKIPFGLFIPPAPPVPPREVVSSPNGARPVIGSAHESGGEIDRQIAASATGAAIAASGSYCCWPLSPPAPPSPPRLTIGAPKLSVRSTGLKPPMIVRPLFVLLIWAPGCPGLPGLPGSSDHHSPRCNQRGQMMQRCTAWGVAEGLIGKIGHHRRWRSGIAI